MKIKQWLFGGPKGPPSDFVYHKATDAEREAGTLKWVIDETYQINLATLKLSKGQKRVLRSVTLTSGRVTSGLVEIQKGVLTLYAGWSWDGASGPAPDTLDFHRSSAMHDALYGLMRKLEYDPTVSNRFLVLWRKAADAVLQVVSLLDGMPGWYAFVSWRAVRRFGNLRIW